MAKGEIRRNLSYQTELSQTDVTLVTEGNGLYLLKLTEQGPLSSRPAVFKLTDADLDVLKNLLDRESTDRKGY